jgi:thioredoxin-related protein
VFLIAGLGLHVGPSDAEAVKEVKVGEGGLHIQSWFNNTSFLDLAEDYTEAEADGKRLAILFEQRGCPYCREMHEVNLVMPEVVDYIKANFNIVQLNMWGDREVTDFDGQSLSEKDFARKHRVMFTPTILYPDAAGKEVMRMPGYFKPFHFKHLFMYVKEEGYTSQPNFQRWLQAKGREYEAKGIEVKLWD